MPSKKPESLFSILRALGEFTLLVFGIIGIAVRIFHKQGWLRQLLDEMITAAFTSSLLTVIVAAIALLIAKIWYDSFFATAERINKLGNWLMAAMMILGVYFLFLFITTGSFMA